MAASRLILSKLLRRSLLTPTTTTLSSISTLSSTSSSPQPLPPLHPLTPHHFFFTSSSTRNSPPESTHPEFSTHHLDAAHHQHQPDPSLPEFPTPPELTQSELLTQLAAEQDSILPVRGLISFLDGYHDLTGFPWWVIIVSTTVIYRLSLFPFLILQLHKVKQMVQFMPKLPPIFPRPLSGKSYVEQFRLYNKKRKQIGCPSLLWAVANTMVQMPTFILGMTTIRIMSVNNHAGFDTGGVLWFHNLADMGHGVYSVVLPFLIAGLHVVNTQLSLWKVMRRRGGVGVFFRSYKFVVDGLTLPFFFVGFLVPQGILVYWVTNSSVTLVQHFFLKNKHVRRYFRLPEKDGLGGLPERVREVGDPGVAILDMDMPVKEKKVSVEKLMPKELVNLSIKMLTEGRKDRAVDLLKLALEKDREHIRALIVFGQTLLQDGLLVEAAEHLERALTRILALGPPSNVEELDQLILASLWSGVAYIRQGRNAEGILHFERIAHMEEPADAKNKAHYYNGLLLLASALTNEGRKDEAENYLLKACAYDSANNVYLEQLRNDKDHSDSDQVSSGKGGQ